MIVSGLLPRRKSAPMTNRKLIPGRTERQAKLLWR
jgi:hypothetical protein